MIKHGFSKTSVYRCWIAMIQRCEKIDHKNYSDYGGRGISVCKEWHNPKTFCEWAESNGYKKGLEIDRQNNNGNYEPNNCEFVSHKENSAVGKKRIHKNNSSRYVGIYKNKKDGLWISRINFENKQVYIGAFKDIEIAVKSRIDKEIELFGQQKTNFHFEQKGGNL